MKRSTLSLLFIYCAIFTFAANVYVTPNGNDTLDGSSWETPKATIQKAIAMAEQGDQGVFTTKLLSLKMECIYLEDIH